MFQKKLFPLPPAVFKKASHCVSKFPFFLLSHRKDESDVQFYIFLFFSNDVL